MKPKTPPNTKALQAWQSELRRLENRLQEWEHDLEKREAALERAVDELTDVRVYANAVEREYDQDDEWVEVDDDDCTCTEEEARDGCECPPCVAWRREQLAGAAEHTESVQAVSQDVKWLEELWNLEDKRK